MLESANANVGQVIDNRRVQDLPTPSSSVIYLAQLAPGMVPTTAPTADWAPNQPENNNNLVSQGASTRSNEYLIDGIPNLKSYA